MSDEPEIVDAEVAGPDPELRPAVDEKLPPVASEELVVTDPSDEHALMRAMDAHDVQMLLSEIQSSALRKWVYAFAKDGRMTYGLTVHAVQDIVQRINWTGKAKIGVLPETLDVETVTEDAGKGEEPFYVATIFARDEITGMSQSGTSSEPKWMRLKDGTTKFDIFARTKAINKAERNAMAKFIPEEIEQTVIAMFSKDPSRVERIQTEAEAKVADLPPALTDDDALCHIATAREIYDEIRELGGGRGKLDVTPGHFHAYLTAAQHSHERLADFVRWLAQRKEELETKYAEGS